MNTETKTLIDGIVNTSPSESAKKTLRDLLTRIYINGEIAGLQKAKEIVNPETINVGDEDHNYELPITFVDPRTEEDSLPF